MPAGKGGRGFAHHDEVEEAVVVEVEECGVQAGDAAQLAPQLAGPRVRLEGAVPAVVVQRGSPCPVKGRHEQVEKADRKSTRLNSSHSQISYAVFCLKKKKMNRIATLV